MLNNVCFIKIRSKLSSVLLLCLLRIFMKQTLKAAVALLVLIVGFFSSGSHIYKEYSPDCFHSSEEDNAFFHVCISGCLFVLLIPKKSSQQN